VTWPRAVQVGLVLATFALTPMWWRLPLPIPGDLYLSRFVILVPLGLAVVAWVIGGPRLPRDVRLLWAGSVVLLVGWMVLSREWAFVSNFPETSVNYHPEVANNAALQMVLTVLFALVVLNVRPSLRALQGVLAVWVVVQALIVTLQALTQGPLGLGFFGEVNVAMQQEGLSVVLTTDGRWLRPYGLLAHPNHTGGWLGAATWVSAGLLFAGNRWLRVVGGIVVCVGLWGLLLTFSRGAWMGFAAGGLTALVLVWGTLQSNRELWRGVLATMAGAIIVGGLFTVMFREQLVVRVVQPANNPELTQESVDAGAIAATEALSLAGRRALMELSWRVIREHPLQGVGAGNTPWQVSAYLIGDPRDLAPNYVHNTYIAAWADLGAVGVVLFVVGLGLGVVLALRRPITPERVAVVAGGIVLAVANGFDYYVWTLLPFQVFFWGLLAAAIADAYP
jgi:hypothetical protein